MKTHRSRRRRWPAIMLAGSLGLACVAYAQPRGGAHSLEVQQRLAAAKQRLQLTPEQEAQLHTLMRDEAHKLRTIREKYANDTSLQGRGARTREIRAVQEDFHNKLQGVLSPAQLDEWDKMAAEARAQARERRQQQRQAQTQP